MKGLIFVALMLIVLALLTINDSIVQGNLTEAEKTVLAEKAEAKEQAKLEQEKITERLASTSYENINDGEFQDWIVVQLTHNLYARLVFVFIFIVSMGQFILRKLGTNQ